MHLIIHYVKLLLVQVILGLAGYAYAILVLVITTPFLIFRKSVTFIAKYKDEDITKCVTGLSAMFHRDFDSFEEKPFSSIVTCLKMKGALVSTSELEKIFTERVILKTSSDKGSAELLYPELQQYFTRFLGYSFLKWDREFHTRNHIKVCEEFRERLITHKDLMEIWENLLVKPYHRARSPWELVIVGNYIGELDQDDKQSPDWIIFFRIHHSLADGFCFQKILTSLFETDYVPKFTNSRKGNSLFHKFFINVLTVLLGPYEFINRNVRRCDAFHDLHIPAHEKSKEYYVLESQLIPVEMIKKIREKFSVGFTSVLIGILSGGLRKYLLNRGKPIPLLHTMGVPYPPPDRSEGLGNEFSIAPLELPLSIPDQRGRLQIIQTQLEKLTYSTFMNMLNWMIGRTSNFPSHMLRAATLKSFISSSYSTMPGPNMRVKGLGGRELIEANFTHGMSSDSLGLCFSSITFNGHLRITIFIDKNVVESRRDAEYILRCVMEEYKDLARQAT